MTTAAYASGASAPAVSCSFTLDGALGSLETIGGLCIAGANSHVVVSDTAGHIKIWNVERFDGSTPERASESFVLVRPQLPASAYMLMAFIFVRPCLTSKHPSYGQAVLCSC